MSPKRITLVILVAMIVGCQTPPTFFDAEEQAAALYPAAQDRQSYIKGYRKAVTLTATYPNTNGKPDYTAPPGPYQSGWRDGQEEADLALAQGLSRSLILAQFGYEEIEVDGFLRLFFEHQEFRPLNSNQVWWIAAASAENYQSYKAIVSDRRSILDFRRPAIARVRGMLSPQGRHGHMNGYPHAFVAIEVLEIRPTTAADLQRYKSRRGSD